MRNVESDTLQAMQKMILRLCHQFATKINLETGLVCYETKATISKAAC